MLSKRKTMKGSKVKMSKSAKSAKYAAQPAEAAVAQLIEWLRSPEGRARSAQIFQETQQALQKYRELQEVDPNSIYRPVTI